MALQVGLPLNKNGADKNQGLANINITSTATYDTSGKLGGSYYFSGSSNRISFPSQPGMAPNDTNSISIAMGVKADSFNYIIACEAFEYKLSSSSFMGRLGNGGTNTFSVRTSGITFTTGTWYHLCGTGDAKNKKLAVYVNGELVKELTSTLTSYNNISSTIDLVYNGSGNINDFRFYDHCLSPKEVKEIAKGLVLHYPLNDSYVEGTSNLFTYPTPGSNCTNSYGGDKTLHKDAISVSGGSSGYNSGVDNPSTVYHAHGIMMDGLPTMRFPYITNSSGQTPEGLGIAGYGLQASNFVSGIKYTVSFDAKADENNSPISCGMCYKRNASEKLSFYDGKISTTLTTNGKHYSITYTSQGANTISSFIFYGSCSGSKGNRYVRNVQLELKDHATPYTPNTRNESTVYDCSGHQNNGTASESLPYALNSPRYKGCYYFNATSKRITLPTINMTGFADTFSISGWGNAPSYSNGIMYGGFSNGNRLNYFRGLYCNTNDGSNNPYYVPNTTTTITVPSINEGHHFVMVGDGSTNKLYMDGELYGIAKTYKGITGNTIVINGYDSSVNYKTNGYISDFRIYSTALSADDIKELYNVSCIINS